MSILAAAMIIGGIVWFMLSKSLFDSFNEQQKSDPSMANELKPQFSAQRRGMLLGAVLGIAGVIVLLAQLN